MLSARRAPRTMSGADAPGPPDTGSGARARRRRASARRQPRGGASQAPARRSSV